MRNLSTRDSEESIAVIADTEYKGDEVGVAVKDKVISPITMSNTEIEKILERTF